MKRALVLSGGGSHGAYEVGAIKYLYGELQTQYDIICGVSVGALNGSFLCQYSRGREKLASAALDELWGGLDTSKIYKKWLFRWLACLWRSSVYNSAPLEKLVRSKLDSSAVRSSGKSLRVGATNLKSGEYKLFDEMYPDLPGAVLASSSFPVMLCPIKLEGELWTDGGVRSITPLQAAIDLNADEIDVIVTSPHSVIPRFPKNPNVLRMISRSLDIMTNEIVRDDLERAFCISGNRKKILGKNNKDVPIRLIQPTAELNGDSLDFSQSLIQGWMQIGYTDAKRILNPA